MPASRTAERLRRLLAVVPYVVRHPGTPARELATLFGVAEAELLTDLNLLFLTGLPPYGPGDLVEVDIDDEGRVWIRMADHFSRPVRLTRTEALSLYLRGKEILGAEGVEEQPALASALGKIEEALGAEALGELRAEVGEGGVAGPLSAVRDAVAGRESIEIEYYSATRDELTKRTIDPEQVFSAIGNWYLVAWDRSADDERMFRVDRIRSVRPTGQRFDPRGLAGAGRDLYTPTAEDTRVRLRLRPGARWVAEYYHVEDTAEHEHSLDVTLPTKDLTWVTKLILRLAGQVEVLEPEELRDRSREVAERTLERYA